MSDAVTAALNHARALGVRVDMWAFPAYTKVELRLQPREGYKSWQSLDSWKFPAEVSAGDAISRTLRNVNVRVDNGRLRELIVQAWYKAAYADLDYGAFYESQNHRLAPVDDPEGCL